MANIAGKAAKRLRARERERTILNVRLTGDRRNLRSDREVAWRFECRCVQRLQARSGRSPGTRGRGGTKSLSGTHRGAGVYPQREDRRTEGEGSKRENCDTIAHLSLAVWRWEQRRAALLGLDAPRKIEIEDDGRLPLETERAILEAARSSTAEPTKRVTPDLIEAPPKQLTGPVDEEPPVEVEPELYDIDKLRGAAAIKREQSLADEYGAKPAPSAPSPQSRLEEIHAFQTLVAHGQAIPPTNHPSGRPWAENESRLPHHLVPGMNIYRGNLLRSQARAWNRIRGRKIFTPCPAHFVDCQPYPALTPQKPSCNLLQALHAHKLSISGSLGSSLTFVPAVQGGLRIPHFVAPA